MAKAPPARPPPLIIVANRLPVTLTGTSLLPSSGGLVSALLGAGAELGEYLWVGWLGEDVAPAARPALAARLLALKCAPVWLEPRVAELHYNVVCNDLLWPILHGESLVGGAAPAAPKVFEPAAWDAYVAANAAFADAVLALAGGGGGGGPEPLRVWVHDYHLMLLPAMLRAALPSARVGFFLHTPFPPSMLVLPRRVRAALLAGTLAADLVGVHTEASAAHVQAAAARELGAGAAAGGAGAGARAVVRALPIGIDPSRFTRAQATPACARRVAELAAHYAGVTVVLGVDRLDPIKGVPHRLEAFKLLLDARPDLARSLALVQVAVPSRTHVPAYAALAATCEGLAGAINSAHGTLGHTPCVWINRSVDETELAALYSIADVAAITSLADGFNLVSFEFVACTDAPNAHRRAPGALVLSEFAGAASCLVGAVICNPHDVAGVARALERAVTMPASERAARHALSHAHVARCTSAAWAAAFLRALDDVARARDARADAARADAARAAAAHAAGVAAADAAATAAAAPLEPADVAAAWAAAGARGARRTLLVDVDAFSPPCPAALDGARAAWGGGRVRAVVRAARAVAAADAGRTLVVLVSADMEAHTLEAVVDAAGGAPGVALVAEGGCLVRMPPAAAAAAAARAGPRGAAFWRPLDDGALAPAAVSAAAALAPAPGTPGTPGRAFVGPPPGTPSHALSLSTTSSSSLSAAAAGGAALAGRLLAAMPSGGGWAPTAAGVIAPRAPSFVTDADGGAATTSPLAPGGAPPPPFPAPRCVDEAPAGAPAAGPPAGAAVAAEAPGHSHRLSVASTLPDDAGLPGAPVASALPVAAPALLGAASAVDDAAAVPAFPSPGAGALAAAVASASSAAAPLAPVALAGVPGGAWREPLRPLLAYVAALTPASSVRETANTLTFVCDGGAGGDAEHAAWAAREVVAALSAATSAVPLEVTAAPGRVRVAPLGATLRAALDALDAARPRREAGCAAGAPQLVVSIAGGAGDDVGAWRPPALARLSSTPGAAGAAPAAGTTAVVIRVAASAAGAQAKPPGVAPATTPSLLGSREAAALLAALAAAC